MNNEGSAYEDLKPREGRLEVNIGACLRPHKDFIGGPRRHLVVTYIYTPNSAAKAKTSLTWLCLIDHKTKCSIIIYSFFLTETLATNLALF